MPQIFGTGFSDELRHKRRPMRIAIQHSTEKLGRSLSRAQPTSTREPAFPREIFQEIRRRKYRTVESAKKRRCCDKRARISAAPGGRDCTLEKPAHTHESGKKQRQQPGMIIVQTQKENRKTYQQKKNWIKPEYFLGRRPRKSFSGFVWGYGTKQRTASQGCRLTGAANGHIHCVAGVRVAPQHSKMRYEVTLWPFRAMI